MYKYINTETVIRHVGRRPILWDPTHDLNKDRDARTLAWIEVYEAVYPGYAGLEYAKKRELGKLIQQRWKTARDAYIRSNNHRRAGLNKRRYAFSDELQFLDKVQQVHEADSSDTPGLVEVLLEAPDSSLTREIKVEPQDEEPVQDVQEPFRLQNDAEEDEDEQVQEPFGMSEDQDPPYEPPEATASSSLPRTRKRKLPGGTSEKASNDMIELLKENSILMRNDDMAFCMSLLPITGSFSVSQKLAFRIQVLRLAKEISRRDDSSDSG